MNKLILIFLIGLFSISAFSATKTWDGGGANNNWQTAANWANDVAPVAGDDLVFPANAAQFSVNNNFGFLTNFNSLTFQGGSYTVGGNVFRLSNGLVVGGGIQTFNVAIVLNGMQTFNISDPSAVVTFGFLDFGTSKLTIDGSGTLLVGIINGSGALEKRGLGIAYVAGSISYSGAFSVLGGILATDADIPNTNVTVAADVVGGTQFGFSGFGGDGTVGRVTVQRGGVSAGSVADPTGILKINAGLIFTDNQGGLITKIGGVNPGAGGYDQFEVTGTINLNNARLIPLPLNNFIPPIGTSFTIIKNQNSFPVNGTFENAPEGAIFAGALNTAFRITYLGGDGNDVVITRVNKAKFDFDGDGKSDVSVFRGGNWHRLLSSNSSTASTLFGLPTDKITPADFDGDNRTDLAVYRPSDGAWYILRSSDSTFQGVLFGAAEDIPVPNDFDGDGRADIAVFRPSNGSWYQLRSLNNQFFGQQFGQSGDQPLVGDFDGDGIGDLAVFRPEGGAWYFFNSSTNSFSGLNFGFGTDIPVPADYDGDGKTDVAVVRRGAGNEPNYFYVLKSSDLGFQATAWGSSTDILVPSDYDGDGRADVAVFRPSEGYWYILGTTSGYYNVNFGQSGDKPIPSAFLQ